MLLEQIQQTISSNTELISLLTFFIGLFVGNRFALGRDKRKEFNYAVIPIRAWLISELDEPSPYTKAPTAIELDIFVSYLDIWSRRGFRTAYENQAKERKEQEYIDTYGQVVYRNNKFIINYVRKCLTYTKQK